MHQPRLRRTRPASDARPLGRRARRLGVTVFFVSIAINAALGIYAVLAPGFGETQAKVLGTSLCVTGAVLLALACEPAWERRLLGPVPLASTALSTLAFTCTVAVIWIGPGSDVWTKMLATTFTFAVAGTAASLLALARLAPGHRWVSRVTYALLAAGALMYATLPWFEDPGEWFIRSYGVVMIALAAFVVSVPVLHWMDRGALAVAGATSGDVRFCPYCGRPLDAAAGTGLTCGRCSRSFTVTDGEGDSSSNSI